MTAAELCDLATHLSNVAKEAPSKEGLQVTLLTSAIYLAAASLVEAMDRQTAALERQTQVQHDWLENIAHLLRAQP